MKFQKNYMNNILVAGGNGQLGSEIKEIASSYSNYNFLFTDITDLDITDFKNVSDVISNNDINIIINCAAYTAVDRAESEPNLADKINHLAVQNFGKLAKTNNIKLIHISTDYVFDGEKDRPYIEDDSTNPNSVYGKTKLLGELALKRINPANSIIIRTSWVYSKFGNNFIKTILNLSSKKKVLNIVSDQIGSPTNASDLAITILDILSKIQFKGVEVFHYSNEGSCSWYEFAKTFFEIKRISTNINMANSKEFKTLAKRPSYSVLNSAKIKNKFNIKIPRWEESLKKYCL